mgnify:CR=1 FL=1
MASSCDAVKEEAAREEEAVAVVEARRYLPTPEPEAAGRFSWEGSEYHIRFSPLWSCEGGGIVL